jgi:hypothetical protein
MQGINICSGAGGLGSALTNPTELAFQKGALAQRYSIVFERRRWPDVETAYLTLKRVDDIQGNDQLMAELIAAKFLQHPELFAQLIERGGVAFLERCSHFTQARTERFRAWEGEGLASRFIRNLIAGFELAQRGVASVGGQADLF